MLVSLLDISDLLYFLSDEWFKDIILLEYGDYGDDIMVIHFSL